MKKIITSNQLIKKIKWNEKVLKNINIWKKEINNIINKKVDKVIVVLWPCSIHDSDEALFYAKKIWKIINKYSNLLLVMRTYFEKPRTTIWWKWFINDPNLDWTYDIEKWLKKARKLLINIWEMWIPCSTEILNNISINYYYDLISWWAIWARTVESQIHRELVSNLNLSIWFKNWTSWDIQVSIDAIKTAKKEHVFLWIWLNWKSQIIKSKWNKNCHIILRWWKKWTNYDEKNINDTIEKLKKENLNTWIMIDVSHGNSLYNYKNQENVIRNISKLIELWNNNIIWIMIESNIFSWKQNFIPWKDKIKDLKYWISMTDACIWFDETEKLLDILNEAVEKRKIL